MSKPEDPKLTHEEALATLQKITKHSDLSLIRLYRSSLNPIKATQDEFQGKVSTLFQTFDNNEFGCLVEYTELAPTDPDASQEEFEDDNTQIHAIQIKGGFELRYTIENKENFSEDEIKAFCRVTAVFQSWPYWREFFPSMLGRTGLPTMQVMRPMPVTLAAHLAGYQTPDNELDKAINVSEKDVS